MDRVVVTSLHVSIFIEVVYIMKAGWWWLLGCCHGWTSDDLFQTKADLFYLFSNRFLKHLVACNFVLFLEPGHGPLLNDYFQYMFVAATFAHFVFAKSRA